MKQTIAADFILTNELQNAPVFAILEQLQKQNPDINFRVSDIYNANQRIRNGYKLRPKTKTSPTVAPKRKRRNHLVDGDYADTACYVAHAVSRFSHEEKTKFARILIDKLKVSI
jgi:hypothetical protein